MSERRTTIKLVGEQAMREGVAKAFAEGHKATSVEMSKDLYNLMTDHRKYDEIKLDPALYELKNTYDPTPGRGDPKYSSGCLYGIPVFVMVALEARTIVLVSEEK